MKTLITLIFIAALGLKSNAQVVVVSSSEASQWETSSCKWHKATRHFEADIKLLPDQNYQTIEGWGGCFNERGWKALTYLSENDRDEVMQLLFAEESCDFSYCRMPIGASDYALDYYSLNDKAGDYIMAEFTIARDRKYLLPYIQAAIAIQPDLQVWGSPWTPPAWMKTNQRYNAGTIRMDEQTLEAYALYFQKYVEAYRAEGVNIVAVHPQNEPLHQPKFPSCAWSGEALNRFIRDYLGPRFETNVPDCEIWLGTINGNDNTDEFNEYVHTVFSDDKTSKYVTGAGFQWDGDAAVDEMRQHFPDKKIMQTETKCGWGANDWKYAFETYKQMVWYLERNAAYYLQWNMVLNETGMSSWGWKQNAMITVDTYDKTFHINPQYWAVRHFTHFIKPGAKRIGNETRAGIQALTFQNPEGSIIVVVSNQQSAAQTISLSVGKQYLNVEMPPNSISTLVCE